MTDTPQVVLRARTPQIAELVEMCARKQIPFSGPGSLWEKVTAMGYSCNSLYEMVIEVERQLEAEKRFAAMVDRAVCERELEGAERCKVATDCISTGCARRRAASKRTS